MIKYIVTWLVCNMVQDPCPDAGRTDQFGRLTNPYYTCAVYHAHAEYAPQKKEFGNRDSAMAFYQEAYREAQKYIFKVHGDSVYNMFFPSSGALKEVKIDSVITEKPMMVLNPVHNKELRRIFGTKSRY